MLQGRNVEQGLADPAAHQASAHGAARLIQHPQQRAFDGGGAPAFKQFQVAPRVRIERHVGVGVVGLKRGKLAQDALLRLLHVGQHCSSGPNSQGQVRAAEAFQ